MGQTSNCGYLVVAVTL